MNSLPKKKVWHSKWQANTIPYNSTSSLIILLIEQLWRWTNVLIAIFCPIVAFNCTKCWVLQHVFINQLPTIMWPDNHLFKQIRTAVQDSAVGQHVHLRCKFSTTYSVKCYTWAGLSAVVPAVSLAVCRRLKCKPHLGELWDPSNKGQLNSNGESHSLPSPQGWGFLELNPPHTTPKAIRWSEFHWVFYLRHETQLVPWRVGLNDNILVFILFGKHAKLQIYCMCTQDYKYEMSKFALGFQTKNLDKPQLSKSYNTLPPLEKYWITVAIEIFSICN